MGYLENIELEKNGDTLIIKIDLTQEIYMTDKGNVMIASSHGPFYGDPLPERVAVNMTIYQRPERKKKIKKKKKEE